MLPTLISPSYRLGEASDVALAFAEAIQPGKDWISVHNVLVPGSTR
jgi:hypothetical protein